MEAALRKVDLFSESSELDLRELAGISRNKSFPKGVRIFEQGDAGDEFFIITRGRLRISVLSDEGQELTLAYLQPFDFFGELALLDDHPRSAGAEVVEDAELCSIHKDHFRKLLIEKPAIAVPILRCLARRTRAMISDLVSSTFMSVYQRVAAKLLTLARRLDAQTEDIAIIDQHLTHQELAGLVGTTRETVTKILNDMKRQGLIEFDRHQITILALNRIQRMVM